MTRNGKHGSPWEATASNINIWKSALSGQEQAVSKELIANFPKLVKRPFTGIGRTGGHLGTTMSGCPPNQEEPPFMRDPLEGGQ